MDNKRLVVVSVLLIIIIAMTTIIIINKDSLFKQETKIRYSDGCEERYVNSKLITSECTYGRQLEQKEKT